jgi:hypothetical protein
MDAGTESKPPDRNRRNIARVLVSYRTFSRGWAFRPNSLSPSMTPGRGSGLGFAGRIDAIAA